MKFAYDNTANLKAQSAMGLLEIPPIPRGKELNNPSPFAVGDRVTSTIVGRWKVQADIWGTVKEITDNQNGYFRYMVLWDNASKPMAERLQDIRI